MQDQTTTGPAQGENPDSGLVTAGWIMAFLLPIVGFFVGLALLIRGNRIGHGIGVMIASVIVPVIVVSLIAAGASSELDSYGECVERARTFREMNACE